MNSKEYISNTNKTERALSEISDALDPNHTQADATSRVCADCEPYATVLNASEQYRLQMAAISTAAYGYWKIGDDIHPDYVTIALKDVAKLYEKYDALYKARIQGADTRRGYIS